MAETSPEVEEFLDEDAPSSYSTSTPETRGGGTSITAPGAATGRRKEAIARVRLVPGSGTWGRDARAAAAGLRRARAVAARGILVEEVLDLGTGLGHCSPSWW